MSQPNSATTTPTPAQILAALSPPAADPTAPAPYGMVMLGMANQAYTAQGSAWNVIQSALLTAITDAAYTPPLPSPQPGFAPGSTVAGNWTLDWGPANGANGDGGDNSNLIYIASYRALAGNPNYAAGQAMFFVVGIRGTDTSVHGLPLLQQVLQDIRDFKLYSWPDLLAGKIIDIKLGKLSVPNVTGRTLTAVAGQAVTEPAGRIAHGSMLGFVKIANSTAPLSGPVSGSNPPIAVAAALKSLVADFSATPIVVTGHSLGACQTQLMASYLAWQFEGATVIPFAYAPPTAGEANFVAAYSAQCPLGQFWYNDHDVVPYAYITMTVDDVQQSGLSWAAAHLWTAYTWPPDLLGAPAGGSQSNTPPGPPLPSVFIDLIDSIGTAIPPVYRRPANGVFGLAGNIPQPGEIASLLAKMGSGMAGLPATGGTAQLIWQHFPPCYAQLMTAQYGTQLAPFPFAAYQVSS